MSELLTNAKERTRATFLQGLAATVVISGLGALVEWLNSGDFSLRTLGVASATAATTAAFTYLQRAYVDPYRAVKNQGE